MTHRHARLTTRLRDRFTALSSGDHWDLFRYTVTIGWAVTFLIYTPSSLVPVLDYRLTPVLMGLAIAGAAAGIVGRMLNEHLVVELPGTVMALVAFGFYLFVNVVLAFVSTTDRAALCWIILLAMSFVLERAVGLGRRLWVVLTTPEEKL